MVANTGTNRCFCAYFYSVMNSTMKLRLISATPQDSWHILMTMSEKTKQTLLVATIFASLVPPFLLVAWPSVVTNTISLWAADTLGYAGIVLLL